MKFIFPQNYNFKNKLFGVMDYSTLILNIIWFSFIFCLVNLISNNINFKIFFIIISCFPLLLFSIIGFNHENVIYVFMYILKFIKSNKIYLYKKY